MKRKLSKKTMALIVTAVILAALVILIIIGNNNIGTTEITIENSKIPKEFDGYKIAQVSDLHNAEFGKENQNLIDVLNKEKPNVIVITGDMLDSRRPGYEHNLSFAKKAVEIAPCYFVPGNHEAQSNQYPELKEGLINAGVNIIEDGKEVIRINGYKINLYGICDPLIKNKNFSGDSKTVTKKRLNEFDFNENEFNILLSHRPENFEIYTEYDIDLVLSGHAHGGQFRIPFIGGIYAPNQGLFPEYDSGLYTKNDTNMIVSRGLGKSIVPFRINNDPEVVLIELKSTK